MDADSSLFYSTAGAAARALRVIYNGGAVCYGIGAGSGACTSLGDECHSVWGNANPIMNASFASFNPTLSPDSPAKGLGFIDRYAGALRDALRPYVITTAYIAETGSNYVDVAWNATGNDSVAGTAYEYDLRYSTSVITPQNFVNANQATGEPAPQIAGTGETYRLEGLNPGTTYRLALRVADVQGNWSEIALLPCAETIGGQGGNGCPEGPGFRAQRVPNDGEPTLPARVSLGQNGPNPWGANTTIEFALPTPSAIRLEVFDLVGRRIRVLREGGAPAGVHKVGWDRRDDHGVVVGPGVYFYRLLVGASEERRRMVLVGQ